VIYVLDANAMIALLNDETGADVVEQLLLQPNAEAQAHAVNICEVFYDALRVSGEAGAQQAVSILRNKTGVHIRMDMDDAFWQDIGRLKVAHRLSLADCFGVVLARRTGRTGGQLVTSDHHELDPLAKAGFPITFFR
jgi:PIN domain nuclease of toxin-antitoxin system